MSLSVTTLVAARSPANVVSVLDELKSLGLHPDGRADFLMSVFLEPESSNTLRTR